MNLANFFTNSRFISIFKRNERSEDSYLGLDVFLFRKNC